jgi:hypothetical protein
MAASVRTAKQSFAFHLGCGQWIKIPNGNLDILARSRQNSASVILPLLNEIFGRPNRGMANPMQFHALVLRTYISSTACLVYREKVEGMDQIDTIPPKRK